MRRLLAALVLAVALEGCVTSLVTKDLDPPGNDGLRSARVTLVVLGAALLDVALLPAEIVFFPWTLQVMGVMDGLP